MALSFGSHAGGPVGEKGYLMGRHALGPRLSGREWVIAIISACAAQLRVLGGAEYQTDDSASKEFHRLARDQ
jgi:hypothetical protein